MPFAFTPYQLSGLVRIEARTMRDERGWFQETYQRSAFRAAGIGVEFDQDNVSWSARRGTLRGLHYQLAPSAQGKLVRCVAGRIFDVAVDIRPGSPAYARWASIELVADDGILLWIPPGFAHGFQALVEGSALAYKTTAEYSPAHERGIRWDDSRIGVTWPIADPVLSRRDAALPALADAEGDSVAR